MKSFLRKICLFLILALLLAAVFTALTDRKKSFEEKTARVELSAQANQKSARCPLAPEQIDIASSDALMICLRHGLVAYDAARRYPQIASSIFGVYGNEPVFTDVFYTYGHAVLPIVQFFIVHGSKEFTVRHAMGEGWQQFLNGKSMQIGTITPEQYGLIAIYEIKARGYQFLAEFEIVNGEAKRKQVTRIVLSAMHFLVGNLSNLEAVLTRGERLPTIGEVATAALDATIVLGGAGAILKMTKVAGVAGKVTKVEKASTAASSAIDALTTVGKTTIQIAPLAFMYVALVHPDLLASAGGWIAEQAGFPRALGIFLVYLIGTFAILWVVRFFLRPVVFTYRLCAPPVIFITSALRRRLA